MMGPDVLAGYRQTTCDSVMIYRWMSVMLVTVFLDGLPAIPGRRSNLTI